MESGRLLEWILIERCIVKCRRRQHWSSRREVRFPSSSQAPSTLHIHAPMRYCNLLRVSSTAAWEELTGLPHRNTVVHRCSHWCSFPIALQKRISESQRSQALRPSAVEGLQCRLKHLIHSCGVPWVQDRYLQHNNIVTVSSSIIWVLHPHPSTATDDRPTDYTIMKLMCLYFLTAYHKDLNAMPYKWVM